MLSPLLVTVPPDTSLAATLGSVSATQSFERPPPPALRLSFRWTLAGSLVYSLCQWGMLSILAKQGDAGTVGRFALALAIASPVFVFTNLTLRAVQVTDAQRQYCFADYFTLRVATTLVGLLAVVSVAATLHGDLATRWIVVLVAIARSIECISDIVGGLFQTEERLELAAVSLMIRGGLSLFAFASTFLLTHSLVACSAALCAAWMVVLFGYDLPRARALLKPSKSFFNQQWRLKGRLALLSLPLGLVLLLVSLNGNIPRYLLERFAGPAQLGIFASLAYLLIAVSTVVNALGQAATVRLATMFAAGNLAGFQRLMLKLLAIGSLVLLLGLPLTALFGRAALTLIYRPEYGQHQGAFQCMVAASGVGALASFLGYGVTATRSFRIQLPLTGASAVATAAVTVVLVPARGILGAAIALLASALVLAGGYALVLFRTIARAKRAQQPADGHSEQDSICPAIVDGCMQTRS